MDAKPLEIQIHQIVYVSVENCDPGDEMLSVMFWEWHSNKFCAMF